MGQKNTCHECGREMMLDTHPVEFSYKDETFTVDMPGWYCTRCGRSTHTKEDCNASEQAFRDAKTRAH